MAAPLFARAALRRGLPSLAPGAVGGVRSVTSKLFLAGLPDETTEHDVKDFFSDYGTVVYARVIRPAYKERATYGFVTFERIDSALMAYEELEIRRFNGRTIYPGFAEEMPNTGSMLRGTPRGQGPDDRQPSRHSSQKGGLKGHGQRGDQGEARVKGDGQGRDRRREDPKGDEKADGPVGQHNVDGPTPGHAEGHKVEGRTQDHEIDGQRGPHRADGQGAQHRKDGQRGQHKVHGQAGQKRMEGQAGQHKTDGQLGQHRLESPVNDQMGLDRVEGPGADQTNGQGADHRTAAQSGEQDHQEGGAAGQHKVDTETAEGPVDGQGGEQMEGQGGGLKENGPGDHRAQGPKGPHKGHPHRPQPAGPQGAEEGEAQDEAPAGQLLKPTKFYNHYRKKRWWLHKSKRPENQATGGHAASAPPQAPATQRVE